MTETGNTAPDGDDVSTAFAGVSQNYRGTIDDPHPLYARMRRDSPVYEGDFMAELGVPSIARPDAARPVYTLFKYDDVMTVLRDARRFTSGFIAEGLGAFMDNFILTGMDGDDHKAARALLMPVFSPAAVKQMKTDRIDTIIRDEYVLKLKAKPEKSADLISEFGLWFPIRVIYSLIGYPENDPKAVAQYAAWGLDILAGPQVDPAKAAEARAKAMHAAKSIYDATLPIIEQRRAEGVEGIDLISRLISAEDNGNKLTDDQIATFVRGLLPAAAETTTRTFGTAMGCLLSDPELTARVRDDRSLISTIVDEAVRYEPTATFKVREVAEDVTIRGTEIKKGAMVSCIVSSANRDEDVFDHADTFDPFRKQKPSFGFGFGPHMCIGLFVAKAEIVSAIESLFDHLPGLRLDPAVPEPFALGLQLRGPEQVRVVWD
jgi:cytochrome P450